MTSLVEFGTSEPKKSLIYVKRFKLIFEIEIDLNAFTFLYETGAVYFRCIQLCALLNGQAQIEEDVA